MIASPRPGLWQLFTTWLSIGIQSFGGGSSTLFLINQACLKNSWLTESEFVRVWALVQISPGINLVKLTILIGQRLRGWPGVTVAAAGLLIPSATVTVLMTAGYTSVRGLAVVQAAMRGILPATIGLGLAMALQMALPLFRQGHREGPLRLGSTFFILVGAALMMALGSSPLVVLLSAGVAAILLFALLPVSTTLPPGTGSR